MSGIVQIVETFSRRHTGLRRKWISPFSTQISLGIVALIAWEILPGLLPLVSFGLLVSVLGEGLVGFTLAIAGGVGVSLLYPHLFGWASYNGGQGVVPFVELIMSPMNSVIVGLLFLNAFFVLMFQSRHAQTYALPMIRSKLRTAQQRLIGGLVMAVINFCDDLAAGGVLNRLYENDIKSPGVSELFKRRMLVMILLLANSLPAIVPLSSWAAFYSNVDNSYSWQQSLYILLPLSLVFYCVWMVLFSRSKNRTGIPKNLHAVIGVDFLREKSPPDPGIGFRWLIAIMLLPMVLALLVLGWYTYQEVKQSLLIGFSIGLLAQLGVMTALGWWEHYARPGASPVTECAGLEAARDGASTALRNLGSIRKELLAGPIPSSEPLTCCDPGRTLAQLDEAILRMSEANRSLGQLSGVGQRMHAAISPDSPLCGRLAAFWKNQVDKNLSVGITEMTSALLRVYLMLVLADATKTCFGLPLDIEKSGAVSTMLAGEGSHFAWLLHSVAGIEVGEFHFGLVMIALGVGLFLAGLRHLRLSSAWGVLAIVYPLVAVILEAVGIVRLEGHPSLVHACFFGLIISFGVWCNSTLPTGDNVSIAAEVHELDPDELALLSARVYFWPLILSALGLVGVIGFHRIIEGWWGWLTWGVLPIALAGVASGLGYYVSIRKHFRT